MITVLYSMLNADSRTQAYAAMLPVKTEEEAIDMANKLYGDKPGYSILHVHSVKSTKKIVPQVAHFCKNEDCEKKNVKILLDAKLQDNKCQACNLPLHVQAFYCSMCNSWRKVIVHNGNTNKVKLECAECKRTVIFLACQLPFEVKALPYQ